MKKAVRRLTFLSSFFVPIIAPGNAKSRTPLPSSLA